jgi:hypothetical protein
MPWYFVFVCVEGTIVVDCIDLSFTILGTRMLSFWKRGRLATRRRLNGVAYREPSRMGRMNFGQRREQMDLKVRMSRPECLARESQTAEQKRDHVSFVSFVPPGNCGEGSVREMICMSSALV